MTNKSFEIIVKTIIDELKSICSGYGLGNSGKEYEIISQAFTYKFLNDKLLKELKDYAEYENGVDMATFIESIDDTEYKDEFLEELDSSVAKFNKNHFINVLALEKNNVDFHQRLDKAFTEISDLNEDLFSVLTSGGAKQGLFKPISGFISDTNKRDAFASNIIDVLSSYSFETMFTMKYDFFSTIFEYLIADYNKDSGQYAEYFTPHFCGELVADLLVGSEEVRNVTGYDPSAGSGTLLMALAHKIGEDKCSIYSQDISQKSTEFLRLNLIINGLIGSLQNIIQGNTLTEPWHKEEDNLKKFDYIVANPPFKTDFSLDLPKLIPDTNRFFAGLPSVPKTKKTSMAIYLTFMQHIMSSLNDTGKACAIVPSGFCTDSSKIALNIRKHIIDNNWLKGVIQMPSNIFANTGTNVSLIFIDKGRSKDNDKAILIDASGLGTKIKANGSQKTDLSKEELEKIKNTFKESVSIEDFSKNVFVKEIKENDYQINAGRYFDVKFEDLMTTEELDKKLQGLIKGLKEKFKKSNELQEEVLKQLGGIKYE